MADCVNTQTKALKDLIKQRQKIRGLTCSWLERAVPLSANLCDFEEAKMLLMDTAIDVAAQRLIIQHLSDTGSFDELKSKSTRLKHDELVMKAEADKLKRRKKLQERKLLRAQIRQECLKELKEEMAMSHKKQDNKTEYKNE